MHPLAWWAWALGLAVAATRTTSPLVMAVVLATVVLVVLACRDDTPWGRAFGGYLVLAAFVIAVRLAFHVVVGIKTPGLVLIDVPRVALPGWAAGVELFGPITLPGLVIALVGGLRLATLVVCAGAANTLASPRRALRSLPASLHQLGTAVVIAVSVAPQLVTSAAAVRRAHRLRGHDVRGVRRVLAAAVPVLSDALDRSLGLAASMDSRGYARTVRPGGDRRVGVLLAVALLAGALGAYGLLDATTPRWLGVPVLVVGAAAAAGGSMLAGRQVNRTRYRPDPWGARETAVAASGGLAAVALVAGVQGSGVDTGVLGACLAGVLIATTPVLLLRTRPGRLA